MKTFTEIADHYQERFGYRGSLAIASAPSPGLRVSVIIPSYDESPEETLDSLGKNPVNADQVEVLLVLNHSETASPSIVELHTGQAQKWDGATLENGVRVFVIRAFDLPNKHAGVGLARKIGMDMALKRFRQVGHGGLLVCFDADCTVTPNYLHELLKAESSNASGLSINFEHRLDHIQEEADRKRIVEYESWLRYYIQALRYAGYPHAFHTIGSSMAVRASAYARIGGMNRRKAGEDFYFLHKLIPHGNFYELNGCTVFPSARISERVPFGTGRAMLEMKQGQKDFSRVYHPQIFKELKAWLAFKEDIPEADFHNWPDFIASFAEDNNWREELQNLKKRSRNRESLIRNFQFWFDGFKMLKLVHFARDHYFPNIEMETAVGELLNIDAKDRETVLSRLRDIDTGKA